MRAIMASEGSQRTRGMRLRDFAAAFVVALGLVLGAFGVVAHASVTARWLPSCSRELAAYRLVSRQAGLVIGSDRMRVPSRDEARTWFYELADAGDYSLAVTAGSVNSRASGRQFVMALTASAEAALEVLNGASQAGICAR